MHRPAESHPIATVPPVLETCHLRREVNGAVLVADVSIKVTRGEIIAIVGPSGAGKSSLLRLLNRLDEPSSGEVFVEGQDYRLIPPQELRRRVGMIMQLPYLFPGSINDNIRFGPQQQGKDLAPKEIEENWGRNTVVGYHARKETHLPMGDSRSGSGATNGHSHHAHGKWEDSPNRHDQGGNGLCLANTFKIP